MWQKAVRVLLQVSILRIELLFLTHIYQIYFQMIGYNRSVYIRQCFHCFPCTSNHFVSFCLFILFLRKGQLPDYFLLNPSFRYIKPFSPKD